MWLTEGHRTLLVVETGWLTDNLARLILSQHHVTKQTLGERGEHLVTRSARQFSGASVVVCCKGHLAGAGWGEAPRTHVQKSYVHISTSWGGVTLNTFLPTIDCFCWPLGDLGNKKQPCCQEWKTVALFFPANKDYNVTILHSFQERCFCRLAPHFDQWPTKIVNGREKCTQCKRHLCPVHNYLVVTLPVKRKLCLIFHRFGWSYSKVAGKGLWEV